MGAFNAHIQNDTSASGFQPPGELLETYTSRGRNFEIWSGELTETSVQNLVERIQIMISLFIEGGTPLLLDDQDWTLSRWRVYFVCVLSKSFSRHRLRSLSSYEKLSDLPSPNSSPYSIVGYSTSYRFLTYVHTASSKPKAQDFTLPPPIPISTASLPARARISQFLILPSHHSHGHGTHLYNAMVKTFRASSTCTEITVEDPNEAFDDLRDYCDYKYLLENGTFAQISLKTDIDPKLSARKIGVRVPTSKLLDMPLLEKLRKKNKIAPRQFARLVELYLLTKIAPHNRQAGTSRLTQRARATDPNDRAFYYWRLLVKQRVYKKNKDVLIQLDQSERKDKVEQTVGEVVGDYERLLRGMEKWQGGDASASGERRERAKRKVVDEEDEDEDDAAGDRKRARSEVA